MTQLEKGPWILPKQLRRARESLGLSLGEAAKLLKIKSKELEAWETGVSSPDEERLWNIAETYGHSIAYFFTETPDIPEQQDFRVTGIKQRAPAEVEGRRVIVAEFEELCRTAFALETILEHKLRPKIAELRPQLARITQPEELAQAIRHELALGSGPTGDIRSVIEGIGVKVFVVNVPATDFSGTSWWHQQYGPAMLVNRSDIAPRRNFTIAHELAHLLRSGNHVLCQYLKFEQPEERFANRFAAALLMPEDDLRDFVRPLIETEEIGGWLTSDQALDRIARHYNTSREACAWRLEEIGSLPAGFTESKRQEWQSRRPFRGRRGVRWRYRVRDLGKPYTSMVRDAYAKGLLSLSAVADTLRIDIEQAAEWLKTQDEQ